MNRVPASTCLSQWLHVQLTTTGLWLFTYKGESRPLLSRFLRYRGSPCCQQPGGLGTQHTLLRAVLSV